MKTFVLLVALAAALALRTASAQTADLATLKQGYETSIAAVQSAEAAAQAVLAGKYTNAINTLMLRAEKAGKFELSFVYSDEIKRFARDPAKSTPTTGDTEVVRLGGQVRALQQQQAKKSATEILRLTSQHADALAALQKELSDQGRTDEATAVRNERKAVVESHAFLSAEAILLGKPAPPPVKSAPPVAKPTPPKPAVKVAESAKPAPVPAVEIFPPTAKLPADEGGWIKLFDGTTLDGWHGDSRIWTVKDGAITATASDPALNGHIYRLCSSTVLTNFILRARFMIVKDSPTLNSAIWYRSTPTTDPETWKRSGYQFELEPGKWGALKPVKGDYLWSSPPEAAQSLKPTGEWNEIEITADGSKLKHSFNGHLCGQTDDASTSGSYPNGTLLLAYDLRNASYEIRFSDIRAKPLP